MEDGKRTPRSLVYVQLWSCQLILIMQSSTSRSGMCIVKELMSRMHVSKVTRMSKFQISLHVIVRMNKKCVFCCIFCAVFLSTFQLHYGTHDVQLLVLLGGDAAATAAAAAAAADLGSVGEDIDLLALADAKLKWLPSLQLNYKYHYCIPREKHRPNLGIGGATFLGRVQRISQISWIFPNEKEHDDFPCSSISMFLILCKCQDLNNKTWRSVSF